MEKEHFSAHTNKPERDHFYSGTGFLIHRSPLSSRAWASYMHIEYAPLDAFPTHTSLSVRPDSVDDAERAREPSRPYDYPSRPRCSKHRVGTVRREKTLIKARRGGAAATHAHEPKPTTTALYQSSQSTRTLAAGEQFGTSQTSQPTR
jgi:hypothetical protein